MIARTIGGWALLINALLILFIFCRPLILSAPLALVLMETLHPVIIDAHTADQVLEHQLGWWMTFQLLQIALSGLLALLVWRLLAGRHGPAATLSRIGLSLFLLCSLASKGVMGIGTCLLVAHAHELELAAHVCLVTQPGIVKAIAVCYDGPIGTGLVVLGGLAWIGAALASMRAHSRQYDLDTLVIGLPSGVSGEDACTLFEKRMPRTAYKETEDVYRVAIHLEVAAGSRNKRERQRCRGRRSNDRAHDPVQDAGLYPRWGVSE